jgi:hypothetical protein
MFAALACQARRRRRWADLPQGSPHADQMVDDRLPFFWLGQIVARVGDADQKPHQLFVGLVILRDLAKTIEAWRHSGDI